MQKNYKKFSAAYCKIVAHKVCMVIVVIANFTQIDWRSKSIASESSSNPSGEVKNIIVCHPFASFIFCRNSSTDT